MINFSVKNDGDEVFNLNVSLDNIVAWVLVIVSVALSCWLVFATLFV